MDEAENSTAELNRADGGAKKRTENAEIDDLASGLVGNCEKDLNNVQGYLKELLAKQEKLAHDLAFLNQENSEERRNESQELFDEVNKYKEKLQGVKKNMVNLHQRVKNVQKRADVLKDYCSKVASAKKQKQLNEESLIARPSTSGSKY